MSKNILPAVIVVLFIAAVGSIGWYAVSRSATGTGQLQMVAAENFWGDIASQIGGTYVHVTSIITDPNADPHLYESDARDAEAISGARIVIENGLGYDDFIDKLMSASPSVDRQVISAQKEFGAVGNDANPHLWYDTAGVPKLAAAMEAAMAAKDPAHAAQYKQNLAAFDASLVPINNVVSAIKARYAGEPVAYTERVPGYLLANCGLVVATPTGFASSIEDGDDPNAADTQAMDNLMTSHGVKVLLYNAQTVSAVTQHARDLAAANGIPVVPVTETLPSQYHDYQQWQLAQAQALQHALEQ